jgi:hypothetical protein
VSILPVDEIASSTEGGSSLSMSNVPTVKKLDILNLTGGDISIVAIDGKSTTVYKDSGYTMQVKKGQSVQMLDPDTKILGVCDNPGVISYQYKDTSIPFTRLPDAQYYLIDPEIFPFVSRGQFCTVDRPLKSDDGESIIYAVLLFKTTFKPAILCITDKGLLEIRLVDNVSRVIKSFKYNYLTMAHISSKLKRIETVFMRNHVYIHMVVCDPEIAEKLGLEPDLKADLTRAYGEIKVKKY